MSPFHQSPDAHVTLRGFQSLKASDWRGKFKLFSSVMAEEHWYHFSDDEEDALLDRAYDRWEQLGGAAAARGPLFHFHMQPIGRRRRWREVVERAQFNAQLRTFCGWG